MEHSVTPTIAEWRQTLEAFAAAMTNKDAEISSLKAELAALKSEAK